MTSGGESERLFEAYSSPSPARPLFQIVFANLNRCQQDHTVPAVATRANYKLYGESTAVTDPNQFADRGHSLTTDGRWRQVADFVLGWLTRRGISATAPSESRLR
jgi:hypothetical protein